MASITWTGALTKTPSSSVRMPRYITQLPSEWIVGGAAAYLGTISVSQSYPILGVAGNMTVRLAATLGDLGTEAGPEFVAALETNLTMTFVHATAGTLVVNGPNAPGSTTLDDNEPYGWFPSNSAEVITFVDTVAHLDDVTVTIDDGLTPPLPDASAPTVTIGNVTSVDEGESLVVTATVSGGTYDTLSLAGAMSSGGGSIGAFTYATGTDDWRATYIAPAVTADINVQLTVTATATGTGTNAADGTTDDLHRYRGMDGQCRLGAVSSCCAHG